MYLTKMLSGRTEKLVYSLSRWTDLPAAKWDWFERQLEQGWMVGFDPRTAMPETWSLAPRDVLGLVFWTKNPRNLIASSKRLLGFPLVVHFTLTGWHEVEKGAPSLEEGLELMQETVATFGASRVTWRFSPVPMVPDVLDRFERIAIEATKSELREVYVSFLQENDLLPETRNSRYRGELLKQLAGRTHGLCVRLCNEDRATELSLYPENQRATGLYGLDRGVCEDGKRFAPTGYLVDCPPTESCGCALAVDPFTINESCSIGCAYCYAGDRHSAPKKRNTTRHLPVLP